MTKEQEKLCWSPMEIEINSLRFTLSYDEEKEKYTLEDNTCCGYYNFMEKIELFDSKQEAIEHLKGVLSKVKSDIDDFIEKGLEERWNKKSNQTSAMYVEAKTT